MRAEFQRNNTTLKLFKPSQADLLFKLIDKNRNHLRKWFPWVDETKTTQDVQKFLKLEQDKNKRGEGFYFGVWYENKLAGVVSFNYINKLNKSATIGYWLNKECEGKGIMTTACKLLISYGFKVLHLHRIDISHAVGNIRSEKIPKKLGFTKEGHFRESGFVDGQFVDQEYYAILAEEWKG